MTIKKEERYDEEEMFVDFSIVKDEYDLQEEDCLYEEKCSKPAEPDPLGVKPKDYSNYNDYLDEKVMEFERDWYLSKWHIKCTECNRMFRSKGNLKSHMRKHFPIPPQPKPKIDKKTQVAEKTIEVRTVPPESYDDIDAKIEAIERELRDEKLKRRREKLSEKTYICPICNKVMKYASNLSLHVRAHLNPGFECPHCHKIYKNEHIFDEHVKNHSNKEFSVHTMKRSEIEKSLLKLPLGIDIKLVKESKIKKIGIQPENCVRCGICKRYFQNIEYLRRHQATSCKLRTYHKNKN
ncbi:zinc finger protein 691-like isoform X2 [Phlebotomus papatasi]|uniref:zinc finger protein 691-like isoform X2 n=1 Tax=Phlebotomus papatasi TaxID=29031 RepID=UPI00248373BD|nr:zinc finger protein 691-like isoform X2 [Phlebotomus papatasi]